MHEENELRAMFRKIADTIEAKRIPVHVHGRIHPAETDLGGMFVPRREAKVYEGDVNIYRDHEQIPGNAMDELLTLAHECGHACSFLQKWSTDAYRSAADKVTTPAIASMNHDEKLLVLDEEALAWRLARSELDKVGFKDWGSYEVEVKRALAVYRDKLSLTDEEVARSRENANRRVMSG